MNEQPLDGCSGRECGNVVLKRGISLGGLEHDLCCIPAL